MKFQLLFAALLFWNPCLPAQQAELSHENLSQWRDHILAAGDDLTWQKIPWLISFADGIQAANDADKPLLLWTMNGHPLGCT